MPKLPYWNYFSVVSIKNIFPTLNKLSPWAGGAVGVSSALFILPRKSFTSKKCLKPKDQPQKQGEVAPCVLTNQSKSGSNQAVDFSQSQTCKQTINQNRVNKRAAPPQGVVVAIIINMIDVSVNDIAQQIARMFEDVDVLN